MWGDLGWGFTGFRSFQYGAETEKLQKQLASEKEIQMKLQGEVRLHPELLGPLGGRLSLTGHQQALASAGSVTHCTYTVPLVRPPAPAYYLCAPCVYLQSFPGPGGVCEGSSGNVPPLRP